MKEKAAAAVIDTTLIDALTPPLRVRVGSQVRDVVGAVRERHPPPAAPFTRMLEFGSKLVLYQHFLLHRAPLPQLCVGGEAPTPHKNRGAGEKRRPRCPRGKRSPVKLGSGQQSQRSDPHSHQKTPPPRRFCCQLESATDSPRRNSDPLEFPPRLRLETKAVGHLQFNGPRRKGEKGGEGNGSLCPRGSSASSCRLLKTNKLNPPPSGVSGNSWDREKVVPKSGRLRTSGFRGAGARWRLQLGAASRGSSERGPPPLPPSCGFPRAGPVQAEPRVPASLGGGPGRGCPEGRLLPRPAGKGRNPPRSAGRPSASWEARVHVLRLPKRARNRGGRRAHGNQQRKAGTGEPNEPDRARPRALVAGLLSATGTRAPTHGECLEWSRNGGPFV
ncbi:uncharacterized protein LOC112624353 [Theropithecus gelada]|uniref:uncharacterized protein LOC112624353 n=1 Tax=Theropithecus gelada TaxID=9565 RepID=UPI000DC1B7CC|nr:uncharacterized protein LOC112624353 [Theropithecus gelada]